MVAELFHVDGRTEMMTLIVAFRNFANAPKNNNKNDTSRYSSNHRLTLNVE